MEPESLPPLYVIYSNNPSNSGRVHSDVRKSWLAGDVQVRQGMEDIAKFARLGRYPPTKILSVHGCRFNFAGSKHAPTYSWRNLKLI